METFQHILEQIPVRHDFISQFILLGIVQGYFIALIILIKSFRSQAPIQLLGYFFLAHSTVLLDDFLCYTGMMKYTIGFNDSTEPLVLLWAPLLYLFLRGILLKQNFNWKKDWLHFLVPVLYAMSQIGYYLHPRSVKLNAYLSAYFPDSERSFVPQDLTYEYQLIKDEFRWLIILSFLFYIAISLRLILRKARQNSLQSKDQALGKYGFSKYILLVFGSLLLIILTIFLNFDNDLGDHFIGVSQTVFTFLVSLMIISESRFFAKSWVADKYDTLKLQDDNITIDDIRSYISENSYYLNKDASLKDLALKLEGNPNFISKTINLEANMNFNEFINSYRVDLSKDRLLDSEYSHLTIEGIANSVGFKSKSAFYNAFKKRTKVSPSIFVKESNN